MISLLTINVRGVSNKHCLLPFFIHQHLQGSEEVLQGSEGGDARF